MQHTHTRACTRTHTQTHTELTSKICSFKSLCSMTPERELYKTHFLFTLHVLMNGHGEITLLNSVNI